MEKVKIGLVLVLLLCIQYSFAQEKRISLDFRNESMPSALKKIAQAAIRRLVLVMKTWCRIRSTQTCRIRR